MDSLSKDTFYVVPLEGKVLLPSMVVRTVLCGQDAAALLKKYFKLKEHEQQTLDLACIPLPPKQHTSLTASGETCTPTARTSGQPAPDKSKEAVVAWENHRAHLFGYGCIGKIVRVQRLGVKEFGVFIEGVTRFKVVDYAVYDQLLTVSVDMCSTSPEDARQHECQDENIFKALAQSFVSKLNELQVDDSFVQRYSSLSETHPAHTLADMLMAVMETSLDEKLLMLATENRDERLRKASMWLTRQLQVLKLSDQIQLAVEGNLTTHQCEFYLQQQLEEIKNELSRGERPSSLPLNLDDGDENDMIHLGRRLAEAKLPDSVLVSAQRELAHIKRLSPSSTEWALSRNYLELLADIPWNTKTEDQLDIGRAKTQLDKDHFGMELVKKRIIEYLSVAKIKGDLKAPILCLVGPPGVGKTSLARSIATALGRKFHRVSLGGVRDEAEIRGHRRAYVGAMPGVVLQSVRRSGVRNPVILLDEIDKLVQSPRNGDPSAALLEVLDPEQNSTFLDHYLNVPFDLSSILFIATANSLDTIPEPLLDRMEVISLHGYTLEEKLRIARTHLLTKQIALHGLCSHHIELSDALILQIAEQYTRESGVRNLDRMLAAVVRSKCVDLATLRESNQETNYQPVIQPTDLVTILGRAVHENELAEANGAAGVVTGLAYARSGQGTIMFVQSAKTPGKGDLRLTGSLGDVMQESAQIALTWVKTHAYDIKLATSREENIFCHHDIHIHFPLGSVPKDGPSAGVALVCALVSLMSGSCVSATTAMTGEISLRGQVLPVGGIKEKVIAAHRAGIDTIILPYRNRNEVDADVPDNIKAQMVFVYAKTIGDVLQAALLIDAVDIQAGLLGQLESHL